MYEPLIDALVQKTAGLVADLATMGPTTSRLAHLPDLFFEAIADRLIDKHDKSRRVVAEALGLSVRALQRRLADRPSSSERGGTIEARLYDLLSAEGPLTRTEIEQRLAREDPEILRSILRDLDRSGVLLSGGRGGRRIFQVNPRLPVAEQPAA